MAENIGEQFESNLSKLSEKIISLANSLKEFEASTKKTTQTSAKQEEVSIETRSSLVQMKKQIDFCNVELDKLKNTLSDTEAFNTLNTKLKETAKKFDELSADSNVNTRQLEQIANEERDTGEKIGELLKNEKEGLNVAKDTSSSIEEVVRTSKQSLVAQAEAAREAKQESTAGAINAQIRDAQGKFVKQGQQVPPVYPSGPKTESSSIVQMLKGLFGTKKETPSGKNYGVLSMFGESLSKSLSTIIGGIPGIILGFVTSAIPMYMTTITKLLRLAFFPLEAAARGIAFLISGQFKFKPIIDAFKSFETISTIGTKISTFFQPVTNFFGTLFQFFTSKATAFKTTIGFMDELFGEATAKIFSQAFKFGAKIAAAIPFLSLIPTAIETVRSAFSKFETEGFKGVFKSIMVGILKGLAAFFTLGLSDLVLDFDKLFDGFSKQLDTMFAALENLVEPVMGLFNVVVDIFKGLFNALMDVWSIVQPILMSLFTNVISPLINAIMSVVNFIMSAVNIVLLILKPIISLVKTLLVGVFKLFQGIWNTFIMPLLETIKPILDPIFQAIGVIFGVIGDFFGYLTEVFTSIYEYAKPIFDELSVILGDFDMVVGIISDVILGVYDKLVEGWNFISPMIDGLIKWMISGFQTIFFPFGEIFTLLKSIWETISPTIKNVGAFFGIGTDSTANMNPSTAAESTGGSIESIKTSVSPAATLVSSKSIATPVARSSAPIGQQTSMGGNIVIANSPVTNINGGGGKPTAIPVPLSPSPMHHTDPTRALISN